MHGGGAIVQESPTAFKDLSRHHCQVPSDIVKQINDRLIRGSAELDQMPPNLHNVGDAVRAFFQIVKRVCTSLEKILVRGESGEYPDDRFFHGTACIAEMLNRYGKKLSAQCPRHKDELCFLWRICAFLRRQRASISPTFCQDRRSMSCSRTRWRLLTKVQQDLVKDVWEYVEDLVQKIMLQHSENFAQVQSSCRSAQHVKEL
jgi:hypothetical protein